LSLPPDKPAEHRRIIAFLAQESTASIDEVSRLYDHERAGLEASARIKRFLPIFAIRNVRAALRQSRIKAATPPLEGTTRMPRR
jgi:hypothetical protein